MSFIKEKLSKSITDNECILLYVISFVVLFCTFTTLLMNYE